MGEGARAAEHPTVTMERGRLSERAARRGQFCLRQPPRSPKLTDTEAHCPKELTVVEVHA